MGQPWFELKKQPFPEPIYFFSSNYEFYGSMSARVSTVLDKLAPQCEVYSIDESFLFISGIDNIMSWEEYGRMVRKSVFAHSGLTVGIGAGPSKTLAKAAQWGSKKWPQFGGVLALTAENRARTETMLGMMPVEEVWGCDRRITKKLEIMGIKTALDLSRADLHFIRRNLSVVLERTVRELRGEACIALEEHPPAKQQIVCSRSFGACVETLDDMRQAVCRHAVRAAAKQRGKRQFCRHISVFIKTSPFSASEPYYGNISAEKLKMATQDTRDIVAAAVKCLKRIWLDGHRYAKAGVMLNDLPMAITIS